MFYGFAPEALRPSGAGTPVYPSDLLRSQLQSMLAHIELQREQEREPLDRESEPEGPDSSSAANWLGSLVMA
jgi:hypothetical protein